MLMFGWIPPVWLVGTGLLGISKIVENMELGHNVMHGQFDWLNDPSLNGANYDWDTIATGDDWKHTHNYVHHTYTNIVGKDHDVGYGLLRVSEQQKWEPRFLLNVPMAMQLMVFLNGMLGRKIYIWKMPLYTKPKHGKRFGKIRLNCAKK
jgi:fatty acid desaturase